MVCPFIVNAWNCNFELFFWTWLPIQPCSHTIILWGSSYHWFSMLVRSCSLSVRQLYMWGEVCDLCGEIAVCSIILQLQLPVVYVSEFEKRGNSRISWIFVLRYLNLWNHSSYELQTWYEYSSIILLHSLQIVGPAHFRYERGKRTRQSRSKSAVLWPSLAAHRSGQEACPSF